MSNQTSTTTARKIPACAPRKSGLTNLQLALMGKGVVRAYTRPFTRTEADVFADRRDRRKSGA